MTAQGSKQTAPDHRQFRATLSNLFPLRPTRRLLRLGLVRRGPGHAEPPNGPRSATPRATGFLRGEHRLDERPPASDRFPGGQHDPLPREYGQPFTARNPEMNVRQTGSRDAPPGTRSALRRGRGRRPDRKRVRLTRPTPLSPRRRRVVRFGRQRLPATLDERGQAFRLDICQRRRGPLRSLDQRLDPPFVGETQLRQTELEDSSPPSSPPVIGNSSISALTAVPLRPGVVPRV